MALNPLASAVAVLGMVRIQRFLRYTDELTRPALLERISMERVTLNYRALVDQLCQRQRARWEIVVPTT